MTRMIFALALAVACSVTATAQTPAADTATRDTTTMKDGPVTVAGCVAETSAGQFTLTNATITHKPGSASQPADHASPDKMPADKTNHPDVTYRLSGGTDLKAHVGHKVQVSGTVGKMDHAETGDKASKDKDRAAATSDKAMTKPGTLTVTSMTMISATCP